MLSTYCYICDCYTFKDYEQLIFIKCRYCTDTFLMSQHTFDKVTSILIENKNVNFKNFKVLTVDKHDNMNNAVTNLAKNPTRTILKTLARDIFTFGGTGSGY